MRRSCKLATVESCTGGGIAAAITAMPGASRWFERGLVVYSNAAKMDMVGILPALLAAYGAVSIETARALAEGGLRRCGADYCIAVTGIAGPDGGTAAKPVGTVCFGWAGHNIKTAGSREQFAGDRAAVRARSVNYALAGLIARLRKMRGPEI